MNKSGDSQSDSSVDDTYTPNGDHVYALLVEVINGNDGCISKTENFQFMTT